MPSAPVQGVVLAKTATFYATTGNVATLSRGDTLTLKGLQNATYIKAVYNGVSGYISAKNVMMLVGISARVRTNCWAYEYDGDAKAKLTFGAKVYIAAAIPTARAPSGSCAPIRPAAVWLTSKRATSTLKAWGVRSSGRLFLPFKIWSGA
jgi:hypothetical protein